MDMYIYICMYVCITPPQSSPTEMDRATEVDVQLVQFVTHLGPHQDPVFGIRGLVGQVQVAPTCSL